MSDWKPIYVVGDGKSKKNSPPAPVPQNTPSKPKKSKRKGIRRPWVWTFMVMSFLAGLYLGLKEDYQVERLLSMEVAENIWLQDGPPKLAAFGSTPSRNSSSVISNAHFWSSYRLNRKTHMIERMDCRDISINDVKWAVAYGAITMYDPFNRDKGQVKPKFNIGFTTSEGRRLLVSFNVYPELEVIDLITTYYKGEADNCD